MHNPLTEHDDAEAPVNFGSLWRAGAVLAPQIRQHSILLRAYTAGGDAVKEMKDKVAAVLGGQLAMRESLEADLAALDSTDSAA